METGTGERRDTPEPPAAVGGSEPQVRHSAKKLVGYFDDRGEWTYTYRYPGDWLTPGDGYDYRQ